MAARLVEVAVFRPVRGTFTYSVPGSGEDVASLAGRRVRVPFGRSSCLGVVVGVPEHTSASYTIKSVHSFEEPFPAFTPDLLELARWMSACYVASLGEVLACMAPSPSRAALKEGRTVVLRLDPCAALERIGGRARRKRALVERLAELGGRAPLGLLRGEGFSASLVSSLAGLGVVRIEHDSAAAYDEGGGGETKGRIGSGAACGDGFHVLTPEQAECFGRILGDLESGRHAVHLVHGVTGSGKTEIYLHLLRRVLEEGGGGIVLLPEIALTVPMIELFRRRFGRAIALQHSRLTKKERYEEWLRIRRGEARIVIGARSAVFAPVRNLRLLVIDEEAETSYKQQERPCYHARDVAIERMRALDGVVVLGSATPSLETWWRAHKGEYVLHTLTRRVLERPMPAVTLVDMAEEFRERKNRSLFSSELRKAMAEVLEAGGQVMLFLNRRGYSTYVFCRNCGWCMECADCSVPMTYHFSDGRLVCHHCGSIREAPAACPECGSRAVRYCGSGTEKVEEEFRLNFPGVPPARMDADTTASRTSHADILGEFAAGRTRVLIGTQMIAKGFDFENLDLAGIVNADTMLHVPDFRGAERTFQLVTQVAGRVGRRERPGRVVVQTYNPHHYALQAAARHDYDAFAREELPIRAEAFYPPFSRLVLVCAESPREREACAELERLGELVRAEAGDAVRVSGPAPAVLRRLRRRYRWQLVIRVAEDRPAELQRVKECLASYEPACGSVSLRIDVDPVNLM